MLTSTKLALATVSIVSMIGLASGAVAATHPHRAPIGGQVRAELINRPAPAQYGQPFTAAEKSLFDRESQMY
jgi:hypothetical protein